MEKLILCILQTILVAYIVNKRYKKDKVQAVFFAGLFIYSIFTEINYAYFPNFIRKYVKQGESKWYGFYFFITLSMIALYVFSLFLDRIRLNISFHVVNKEHRYSLIPSIVYNVVLIIAIYIIFQNWNEMSYSINVHKRYPSQVGFVRALNDWNVYYFFITLVVAQKTTEKIKKIWFQFSCVLCMLALALFTYRNGDRSVILLCFVGLFIYYIYDKALDMTTIKKMLPLLAIAIGYLFFVRLSRSNGYMKYEIVRTFLQDDYAFPGMTLIAVMEDKFIHPFSVVYSFLIKGSFILHGEYLYWIVYKEEFPLFVQQALKTGTNPGIGFHIFTEGYIFAGFLGFIYNGFVISLHLKLWKLFYTTDDDQTNLVMSAIIIGIMLIGIRTETVYFVRNFVFFLLPALIMYEITSDKWFRVSIRSRY